jgi:curli production assembly/transport component CsgG/holdfast attachment protein HfaB
MRGAPFSLRLSARALFAESFAECANAFRKIYLTLSPHNQDAHHDALMKKKVLPMSRTRRLFLSLFPVAALAGCAGMAPGDATGVKPLVVYPVTSNDTPYSQCLRRLQNVPAGNLPVFAVGEIADKTGQIAYYDKAGNNLTPGAAEMVMSALYKTGKASLVERYDLRLPLAEVKLAEQHRLNRGIESFGKLPASDFIVVGALTELNYNIVTGGVGLRVAGVGGGTRMAVVNVALDLRVVNARNFSVSYVSSLQKQIYGYEVQADVFRFFDTTYLELEAGQVRNEPLQLGVRSVAEMAVYQIMTDFLRLPRDPRCALVENDHMSSYLEQLKPNGETKQ